MKKKIQLSKKKIKKTLHAIKTASPKQPFVDLDKENNAIWIQWGKLGKQHIGSTEEISLIGCQILVDRNKKGQVKALEIFYW